MSNLLQVKKHQKPYFGLILPQAILMYIIMNQYQIYMRYLHLHEKMLFLQIAHVDIRLILNKALPDERSV